MAVHTPLAFSASAANLRRLAIIRLIVLTCLASALLYNLYWLKVPLIYPLYMSIVSVFALATVLTYWRLQQAWPVTDLEYFCQLLLDIIIVSALLFFSGGATNPFVSYYLVPLTISAALLPWRYTWAIAGLSLLAYTVMIFYYQPLPAISAHAHHNNAGSFNQHVLGMWINFAMSAGLITFFVVRMASTLRRQQEQMAEDREDDLRDEQILAVATLAAGTAHELGTPLATMAVLLDELEQEYQQPSELSEDLQLLKQQVSSCKRILQGLVNTADSHSQGQRQTVNIHQYLDQILEHWQVLRPEVNYQFTHQKKTPAPELAVDTTLEQAITNLLNNAADASHDSIAINLNWNNTEIILSIRDHGPGIPLEIAEQIGKPFVSTKGKGLGLGLFLTHATIDRYGGQVLLFNHDDGGSVAELHLPLTRHNEQS